MKEQIWAREEYIKRLHKALGHLPVPQIIYGIVGHISLEETKRITEAVERLAEGK